MRFFDLKVLVFLSLLYCHAAVAGFYPVNGGMVNQSSVITSAGGTTTLVATSNQLQVVEGATTQTLELPDATILPLEWWYEIANNSTGAVTVNDDAGGLVATLGPRQVGKVVLKARSAAAGTWKVIFYVGVDTSGTIPTNAATADSLSATPAPCGSGEFVTGIEANGDAICSTPTGAGDISGPSSSVDNEIVLFSGTTGKIVKSATQTGILLATAGVIGTATAGTDYQAAGDYITELTGDVTATGPGAVAATVAEVGGETAADVATSVQDTQAATDANTPSTIVKRDASGNFSAGEITADLVGDVTGNADTSTALAANPSDCAANTFANASAANGDLTCSSIPNAATTATASAGNSTIVARDGSGNFAAGTITADLTGDVTGNADTATALATNPTACSAGDFVTDIDADGTLTCDTPAGGSATVTNWTSDNTIVVPSAAFGTVSNELYLYRRVGDEIQIRGSFTVGTPAASTMYLTLKTGFVLDSTKMQTGTNVARLGGEGHRISASSGDVLRDTTWFVPFFDGSTTDQIFLTDQHGSTLGQFNKRNGNVMFSSGHVFTFLISAPIVAYDIP